MLVVNFEDEYQKLGWRYDRQTDLKAAYKFWSSTKSGGLHWLVNRLDVETNIHVLEDVANILAELRWQSLDIIQKELERLRLGDKADTLIKSLIFMAECG